ncbi:hydrolase [Antarcticibacterium sp. 1MA-6-2]|uniref:BT0820 family HAD-type phosphatase n=1 Tax=Antarcticibacterium sp. 1MA-6-2 TaxID=2908210 RepID=UPI001F3B3CF3|nr:hydrolase [Antarcticibacterium sp. 1MA-6-2]UJH91082.1 hydrolase [Antarcticibacterium sp. 1MA-6-2]
MHKQLTIAVDFDGTIVENRYPRIGKPLLFAIETLKKLQDEGHHLILWTYRCGNELEEAVEFCRSKGINFYAVNKSYPEEVFEERISRKIQADIFIDDRNIGGLKGWGEIYHSLASAGGPRSQNIIRNKKRGKDVLHYLKSKL